MNALQFFLTRYCRSREMARDILAGLTEKQIRVAPCEGVNTLVWLVWHIARVEDVGVNRLVLDEQQLFERDQWAVRLNVQRRDFGTGMTKDEVRELSTRINVEQLRAYAEAVAERTVEVAQRMNPDDLDEINDAAYVQRVVDQDGFVTEDAAWVPEYMFGQPKGFFLCHLALTHKFVHVGEANAIRGLMGVSRTLARTPFAPGHLVERRGIEQPTGSVAAATPNTLPLETAMLCSARVSGLDASSGNDDATNIPRGSSEWCALPLTLEDRFRAGPVPDWRPGR